MARQHAHFSAQATEVRSLIQRDLGDYGLREVLAERDTWGLRLILQNATTGLQISYSPPEHAGWSAVIAQLQNGSFPKHPIKIDERTPLLRFDLRDLAAERIHLVPRLAHHLNAGSPLDTAADLIELVSRCADDVLGGEFSVFEALRPRVRARVRGHQSYRPGHAEA